MNYETCPCCGEHHETSACRTDGARCAVATGSALIIGARYRDRKGGIINGGNWILDAADIRENRIRLVPERQTLPLCWESTRENFDATFEILPNTLVQTAGHQAKGNQ